MFLGTAYITTLTDIQTPTGKLWGHISYPVIPAPSQRGPPPAGTPLARLMSSAGTLHVDPVWPRQMKAMRFSFAEILTELLWNADYAECPQSRWLSVCSTRRFWSEWWPYQQGKSPTQLIIIHHRVRDTVPAKHPTRIKELLIFICIWFKSAWLLFRLDFLSAKLDLDQWLSSGFASAS